MKIRILASLLLCVLVAGCGFKLRGSETASHIQALTLVTDSPYNRLSRAIERQLKQQRIQTGTPDSWNLQIIKEKMNSETIAFSDTNYPATREMVLEVRFSVSSPSGEQLIAPNTERVVRVLESDSDRRLAEDREQELLRDEMYDEMAVNLIRRIDYLASQKR